MGISLKVGGGGNWKVGEVIGKYREQLISRESIGKQGEQLKSIGSDQYVGSQLESWESN